MIEFPTSPRVCVPVRPSRSASPRSSEQLLRAHRSLPANAIQHDFGAPSPSSCPCATAASLEASRVEHSEDGHHSDDGDGRWGLSHSRAVACTAVACMARALRARRGAQTHYAPRLQRGRVGHAHPARHAAGTPLLKPAAARFSPTHAQLVVTTDLSPSQTDKNLAACPRPAAHTRPLAVGRSGSLSTAVMWPRARSPQPVRVRARARVRVRVRGRNRGRGRGRAS